MKLSQIEDLKQRTMAHEKKYLTKDRGKQAEYDMNKKMILGKIQLIEDGKIKERKYLEDIQGYVDRLLSRAQIDLMGIGVKKDEAKDDVDTGKPGPQLGPEPDRPPAATKEEADKQSGQGEQTAKPVPEAPGGKRVEGGGGPAPF